MKESLSDVCAGVARQYQAVAQSVRQKCQALGRSCAQVLAVSKTFPFASLCQAYQAGARAFGESYVQEAVAKIEAFRQAYPQASVRWHFIGPIQSNKVKWIAGYFDWVQSVDREKIVERLARLRPEEAKPLNVLIEVNLQGEASKSGVRPDRVWALARKIASYPNLILRGVMAIPQDGMSDEETRQAFAQLRHIQENLRTRYETVDTLSMGMSQDWALALEEGSTCVRIGRAIFGARAKKRSKKMEPVIGFIGGGNMAQAIVAGLVKKMPAQNVHVIDRNAEKLAYVRRHWGVTTHEVLGDWVTKCDVLVLAVKPQGMAEALGPVRPLLNPKGFALSVAAGIEVASLRTWLGGYEVVRTMPNTPAKIGLGVTGLWVRDDARARVKELSRFIVQAVGSVVEVPNENDLDLVGAISGSGPAYVFRFMESMVAAAMTHGMPEQDARKMVVDTVLGAAHLAQDAPRSLATLREAVTSKGGTTAQALSVMNARDIDGMMQEGIDAALRRTEEMKVLFRPEN